MPEQLDTNTVDLAFMARFMLLADQADIALPDGPFTTLADALQQQFSQYVQRETKDLRHALPINVALSLRDKKIQMRGEHKSSIDVYLLKQPVERLNRIEPGLGWMLSNALASAHAKGLSLYEPSRLADIYSYTNDGNESDAEFASEILGQEGIEKDPKDITPQEIEDVRAEYGGYLPSDFLAAMGGHRNLIHWRHVKGDKPVAKPPSIKAVKELLAQRRVARADRALIQAVVELVTLFNKDDREQLPDGWFSGFEAEDEYHDVIGGLGFVVWDEVDLVLETVQHFEENCYNGGEATEECFAIYAPLDDEAAWPKLIAAFKLLIERYAALSKLMGLLPRKDMNYV